jgi:LemA protein
VANTAAAQVGRIQTIPEVLDHPAAFRKFQAAQGELSGALVRLLVVTESHLRLKSDARSHDPMAQLKGIRERHHGRAQLLHQDGAMTLISPR